MALKDYILLNELGKGAFGAVHLAERKKDGLIYAIKIVDTSEMNQDQIQANITECEKLQLIRHPNTINCFESGYIPEENVIYSVLEFVNGVPLDEMAKKFQPFPYYYAMEIGADIARMLIKLDSLGIAHRDVKPGNIIVEPQQDRIISRLIDFGLAYNINKDKPERPGYIKGTAIYIDPAYITDQENGIHPKMDVYALGVVLYELLKGQPPFYDSNGMQVLGYHVYNDPRPLDRDIAPDEINDLILDMLEKKHEDRPDAKEVLVEILRIQKQPWYGK